MTANAHTDQRHVYSIGHSNQDLDAFLRLLKDHYIDILVDVRSAPFSRFAPQFNREILERAVIARSIKYVFMGTELGGRPAGDEFYDADGHVLYSRVAEAEFFRAGIERLERNIDRYRIAIMCSEENPEGCHRRLLIGRVLTEHAITVFHVRGTGEVEEEQRVELEPAGRGHPPGQLALFDAAEAPPWRSVRSVLPRRPPPSSSEH